MLAQLAAAALLEAADELCSAGFRLSRRFSAPGHAVSGAHGLSSFELVEELLKQLRLNNYLLIVLVVHLLLLKQVPLLEEHAGV